jgi:hypothetical protein
MTDNIYLAECDTLDEFQCLKDIEIAIELAYEDGERITQKELHFFMMEVGFDNEDIYYTLLDAKRIYKQEKKTEDYWQDFYFGY